MQRQFGLIHNENTALRKAFVQREVREHHYKLTGYADPKGRLLALDAEITIDGGAYSNWPFTIGLEPGQATGNLPGPYDFRGYRVKTYCVATNKPGFLPYRGVARTHAAAQYVAAACNLIRMAKLMLTAPPQMVGA